MKHNSQQDMNNSKTLDSTLWNKDLAPIISKNKNWKIYNLAALWMCMSITIPTYMVGSYTISSGLNWWQSSLVVMSASIIAWLLLIIVGSIGVKYGIPFPVMLRASFGVRGARVAALLRAAVACGWFGVCTWIQGTAFYIILKHFFSVGHLGEVFGINILEVGSILLFFFVQIYIIKKGITVIKWIEAVAAPLLLFAVIVLLVWGVLKTGSLANILSASHQLSHKIHANYWAVFWVDVGVVFASWAAVILNVCDFTRYVAEQKDQMIGQFIGLVPTSALFVLVGIINTCATIIIFGYPIWNPLALLDEINSPIFVLSISSIIIISALALNMGANVVAAANDFSNLYPGRISFKLGGYIAAIVGILLFPWKTILTNQYFVFYWILSYSTVIMALLGVIISDYYIVSKRIIYLEDLYILNGKYYYNSGWNWVAFVSILIAVIPVVPGAIISMGDFRQSVILSWFVFLYKFGWIISFFISSTVYVFIMKLISHHTQERGLLC